MASPDNSQVMQRRAQASLAKQLTPQPKKQLDNKFSAGGMPGLLGAGATGAVAGGTLAAMGGPAAPITVPLGAAIGGLGAMGVAALTGTMGKEKKDNFTPPAYANAHTPEEFGGKGFVEPGEIYGVEEILTGPAEIVASFPDPADTKNWEKFATKFPTLAQAVQTRKQYEYNQLVQKMEKQNNPGVDPMAVQLLFQNAINPFLNNVLEGSRAQTNNYKTLMDQMLKNTNLPEGYRSMLQTQVPQQVAGMNNVTNAAALSAGTAPGIAALIKALNDDQQTQQYLINQNKINQVAASGGLGNLLAGS